VTLAAVVAFVVFALIFVWLGMVLGATWRTMKDEAQRAGLVRDGPEPVLSAVGRPRDGAPDRERAEEARPPRPRPG
jgi:hypothetical protein